MNVKFKVEKGHNSNCVVCTAYTPSKERVCECKVGFDYSGSTWTISSWFTKENFQNKGIGKVALQKTLACLHEMFGEPDAIEYIWNGANEYVLEWMEKHFDAKCLCPLIVQKTQSGDDWLSHMYDLDVSKALEYFKINQCKEIEYE